MFLQASYVFSEIMYLSKKCRQKNKKPESNIYLQAKRNPNYLLRFLVLQRYITPGHC